MIKIKRNDDQFVFTNLNRLMLENLRIISRNAKSILEMRHKQQEKKAIKKDLEGHQNNQILIQIEELERDFQLQFKVDNFKREVEFVMNKKTREKGNQEKETADLKPLAENEICKHEHKQAKVISKRGLYELICKAELFLKYDLFPNKEQKQKFKRFVETYNEMERYIKLLGETMDAGLLVEEKYTATISFRNCVEKMIIIEDDNEKETLENNEIRREDIEDEVDLQNLNIRFEFLNISFGDWKREVKRVFEASQKNKIDFLSSYFIGTHLLNITDENIANYFQTLNPALTKQDLKKNIILGKQQNSNSLITNLQDFFKDNLRSFEGELFDPKPVFKVGLLKRNQLNVFKYRGGSDWAVLFNFFKDYNGMQLIKFGKSLICGPQTSLIEIEGTNTVHYLYYVSDSIPNAIVLLFK